MPIKLILNISQVVVSVILIGLVLLQQRGSGLSQVFGGEGTGYHTRRGLEKVIFTGTIIAAVLFLSIAITSLFLAKPLG